LLVVLFALLAAPALVSYIEFLPYFSRGTAISLHDAETNPFCANCSISYLFPLAVTRSTSIFDTDVTMRNGYVGIFTLLFVLFGITKRSSQLETFVFIVLLISFVFSLGNVTPVHRWAYSVLPGFNFFRHPANMRLFTSISLLLLAAIYFDRLQQNPSFIHLKKLSLLTLFFVITCAIIGLLLLITADGNFGSNAGVGFETKLQFFLSRLSVKNAIGLEAIGQVLFLLFFLIGIKSFKYNYFYLLIVLNAFVFMQPALATTFVNKESPSAVNTFIEQHAKQNASESILTFSIGGSRQIDSTSASIQFGYPSWYNRRIADPIDIFTPCYLKQQIAFSTDELLRHQMWQYHPAMIVSSQNGEALPAANIKTIKFSPTEFLFSVTSPGDAMFGLAQNHYVHWRAYIDNKEVPILVWNKAFMKISLPAGEHHVSMIYKPTNLYEVMMISIVVWLFTLTMLAYYSIKVGK
jgi:hypothetical protein